MTLFWDPTGPMMKYYDGTLEVSDLNPEMQRTWVMSRLEVACLGWRCLLAALR